MRMWGVNPKKLCNQHLLGEHLEMHMFVGCINKNICIDGYCKNKLVTPHLIRQRHDDLAEEMTLRGMKHQSPVANIFKTKLPEGNIDVDANLKELISRCSKCKERIVNGLCE